MPKKKDVNNQPTPSAQEIKDAVNAGYFAQTNDLDRFLYVVNVGDFANQANLLVNAQRDPQIEDDDFNPITDPEAIAKAREEQCDSHSPLRSLSAWRSPRTRRVPKRCRTTLLISCKSSPMSHTDTSCWWWTDFAEPAATSLRTAFRRFRKKTNSSSPRELEKKDPIKYLEESKAHMVERFGTLKVDRSDEKAYEKTFETVLRYKLFDTFIRAQNSLPPTQDPARIEARFDAVKEDESNVYRNRITEEQKLPYRKAFEALDGRELRLDQMSSALDAKKRELDLAAEGPQAHS